MAEYSAQGSITIKRLRTGMTIYITIEKSKPLSQGIDDSNGAIFPDWTVEGNQPTLTPNVTCSRTGVTPALSGFEWFLSNSELDFVVDNEDGTFATANGQFKMNVDTGALTITDNIAIVGGAGNYTLSFKCVATISGVGYNIEKDEVIQVHSSGASSYMGTIVASSSQLTSAVTSVTLTTSLALIGIYYITTYYTLWYKDTEAWPTTASSVSTADAKVLTITGADVAAEQLFICQFYTDAAHTQLVYVAGIRIIDAKDEYKINLAVTSINKEVDTNHSVTVTATIFNATAGTTVTPATATWLLTVWAYSGTNGAIEQVEPHADVDNIVITTTHTDHGDVRCDVDVIGEATFTL